MHNFGSADITYKAAGGLQGITQLVEDFYYFMDKLPEAKEIRRMHPDELNDSKQKLAYFLSGWMGGPRLYTKFFGKINIPDAHRHLSVNTGHAQAWMLCMQKALDKQPYSKELKQYLYEQLSIPAYRIVQTGVV